MDRRSVLLATMGAMFAGRALAQTAPAAPPVNGPSPFTIDGVIEQQKAKFPDVARPADPPVSSFVAKEDIAYLTRPSGVLSLDLYRPQGKGPFPAVVLLHGGGWESGTRQMERGLARRLTQSGFAALPLSYRLDPTGRFPGDILDIKAGIRWIRAHAAELNIDPSFIAIVGGSAGGHLAAFIGASNGVAAFDDGSGNSRVQAVVDIDGAASFPDAVLIGREEARQGATSRYLGGEYSLRRETWFAASPLTYLSKDSAPTLFINSNQPTPILPGRPEMSARLKAVGIESQIIDMPAGTPHPFWLVEPWFTPTAKYVADFLMARLQATKTKP